jgi:hypothetical protein
VVPRAPPSPFHSHSVRLVATKAIQRQLQRAERDWRRGTARLRRSRRIGLSNVHTSPHDWCEVAPRGSYLKVHIGSNRKCPVPPTTRGVVHGFSRKSRGRLLQTMAKVDRASSGRALFVTLTYPLSSTTDFITCKRHLDFFAKRFRRRFAHGSFVWRLELQKNGTPHFHLIVLNERFIPHEWVASIWYGIVGSGNADHLAAGTEVKRVRSAKAALHYAAKYCAKLPDSESKETEGRVWGVIGRRDLPSRVVQCPLDRYSATRLASALGNLAGCKSSGPPGDRYPPRWLILEGYRAVGLVKWAVGATASPPTRGRRAGAQHRGLAASHQAF